MNTAMRLLSSNIFLLAFSAMIISASPFMDGLFGLLNQVRDTGDDTAPLSFDRPFDGEQRPKANVGFPNGMKGGNLKGVRTQDNEKLGEHLSRRAENTEDPHFTPQREDGRNRKVTEQQESRPHQGHYGTQFDSQRDKHLSASYPEKRNNVAQAPALKTQVTKLGTHLKKEEPRFRGFSWLEGLMLNN